MVDHIAVTPHSSYIRVGNYTTMPMEALRYEKALSLHMLLVWDSDFLDCTVLAEVHNLTHPTTSYKYSTHVTLFEGHMLQLWRKT